MSTSLEIGQKVRVHKNLHRGDWSITVRGRVVAHVASICLADVTFKIRETARLQVIERRCRQVHAWCEGVVCALPQGDRTPITYNPYRCGSFTTRNGKPLAHCEIVHMTTDRGSSPYRQAFCGPHVLRGARHAGSLPFRWPCKAGPSGARRAAGQRVDWCG